MAITVTQTIPDISPVYNPMTLVASSTNVAQPSFSFIFQIYDSTDTTLLRTLRIPPEINYGYGVAPINRILEDYIGTDFFKNTTGTQFKECPNSYNTVVLRIGEEYSVAGVITQFLNLENVSVSFFNGSLKYDNFLTYDYQDYFLNGVTKKFLTNLTTRKVTLLDEGYIHFQQENSTPTNIEIQTYFADGSIDQTSTITNTSSTSFAAFPCNPASLNAATLATGTQPLIKDTTASYVIFAEDGGTVTSATYRFNLVDYCTPFTLHFLNELGGFDSFPFQVKKDNFSFTKETYKQDPLRITAAGLFVYSDIDREVVQNYTSKVKKSKLISDWLTEEESEWLQELIGSPEIYLQNGSSFHSVLIKQSEYQQKYDAFDEIYNLEVEVEYSIDEFRQRF